jgi:hypothetical protein
MAHFRNTILLFQHKTHNENVRKELGKQILQICRSDTPVSAAGVASHAISV